MSQHASQFHPSGSHNIHGALAGRLLTNRFRLTGSDLSASNGAEMLLLAFCRRTELRQ